MKAGTHMIALAALLCTAITGRGNPSTKRRTIRQTYLDAALNATGSTKLHGLPDFHDFCFNNLWVEYSGLQALSTEYSSHAKYPEAEGWQGGVPVPTSKNVWKQVRSSFVVAWSGQWKSREIANYSYECTANGVTFTIRGSITATCESPSPTLKIEERGVGLWPCQPKPSQTRVIQVSMAGASFARVGFVHERYNPAWNDKQNGTLILKGNEISLPDLGSGPRTLFMGSNLTVLFWVDANVNLLKKNVKLKNEYIRAHPELNPPAPDLE